MTLEYSVRGYAGAAPATTLNSGITNSATSLTLASGTGYPTTNFALVLDPGTASEEKVFVGTRSGVNCTSCTRGIDSTSGVSHLSGAVVRHVIIAQDISEANGVASAMTTKGDILTRNSTATAAPQRLAVGANNTRLVADSAQTLGIKWVADTVNSVVTTKGDIAVATAASTVARHAAPANGGVLLSDSTQTDGWANLATSGLTGSTSWTPTLTQSGAVTKTVTRAGYIQIGKLVICWWRLTCTGSGTANAAVTVTCPVTAAASVVGDRVGAGDIDASNSYGGQVVLQSTTTFAMLDGTQAVSSALRLGQTGTVAAGALANTNVVSGHAMYEAA